MQSSTCCICNNAPRDQMNQKWLSRTCETRFVDRVLCPRPERVGRCATADYQKAETVGKTSWSPVGLPQPSRPLCDLHPQSTNSQFATLTATESHLIGHTRSSTYHLQGCRRTPESQRAPDHVYSTTPRTGTGITLRPPGDVTCSAQPGSTQSRTPLMSGAPHCNDTFAPPVRQRPYWSDSARADTWRASELPYERLECWRWNDHPFVLGEYGVGRQRGSVNEGGVCRMCLRTARGGRCWQGCDGGDVIGREMVRDVVHHPHPSDKIRPPSFVTSTTFSIRTQHRSVYTPGSIVNIIPSHNVPP